MRSVISIHPSGDQGAIRLTLLTVKHRFHKSHLLPIAIVTVYLWMYYDLPPSNGTILKDQDINLYKTKGLSLQMFKRAAHAIRTVRYTKEHTGKRSVTAQGRAIIPMAQSMRVHGPMMFVRVEAS